MVEILKALSDENRMRIVNILLPGELCVCEIEYLLNMTQTNVSRHLKILKTAGIIERNKQAQWIHYHISESFKEKNPDLVRYIQDNMDNIPACRADKENYSKYRESGCGCAQIRKIMRGE